MPDTMHKTDIAEARRLALTMNEQRFYFGGSELAGNVVAALADELERLRAQVAQTWQPIEAAPPDELVVVAWWESDETPHHDFDYIEDGCWQRWHDHAEHVEVVGGHGVSYTAPYTHFMRLAPIPYSTAAPAQQAGPKSAENAAKSLSDSESRLGPTDANEAQQAAPSLTVVAGVVPEVAESLLLGQAQQLIGALMNHGLLPKTADEASYLKLWDVVKRQLRCVNQEGGRAALASQPAAQAEPAIIVTVDDDDAVCGLEASRLPPGRHALYTAPQANHAAQAEPADWRKLVQTAYELGKQGRAIDELGAELSDTPAQAEPVEGAVWGMYGEQAVCLVQRGTEADRIAKAGGERLYRHAAIASQPAAQGAGELPEPFGYAWHESHAVNNGRDLVAGFGFSTDEPPADYEAAPLYTAEQMRAALAQAPAAAPLTRTDIRRIVSEVTGANRFSESDELLVRAVERAHRIGAA